MEMWKKIGKALLFPPAVLMIILLPVAVALLVYAMVFVGQETALAYVAYTLSAYTLTVWCVRMPQIIAAAKAFKRGNKYVMLWTNDVHLRMNVTLYGSFIWNVAYAVFQLCLGMFHRTFWYCSLATYYICLAVMRFFLSRHTRRYKPGEKMRDELKKYRTCGWVFLILNLALTLMIFFMVYWNRTFNHHEITTIAMAAYTFTTFTFAVINTVKYRKYESPVFSASKAISLAAASVSMLTLTSTMLTTFGEGEELLFRRIMLGSLGGAISVFIIVMSVYMIVRASKSLRKISIGEMKNERK